MINPGAIVTASLVKNKANIADRFDYVRHCKLLCAELYWE